MNFLSILKKIFPQRPTLDEFIKAHNPVDIYAVERLEKLYNHMVLRSGFY